MSVYYHQPPPHHITHTHTYHNILAYICTHILTHAHTHTYLVLTLTPHLCVHAVHCWGTYWRLQAGRVEQSPMRFSFHGENWRTILVWSNQEVCEDHMSAFWCSIRACAGPVVCSTRIPRRRQVAGAYWHSQTSCAGTKFFTARRDWPWPHYVRDGPSVYVHDAGSGVRHWVVIDYFFYFFIMFLFYL